MFGILMIVGLLICIAIIYDRQIVTAYKWTAVVPVVTILITGYVVISMFTETAPAGTNITNLVEVMNRDSNEKYFWNLQLDVFEEDTEFRLSNGDYSSASYTVYSVTGYVSPETGQLVNVETEEPVKFGEKCYFTESNFNSYEDVKYSAIVNRGDIQASVLDRLKATGIINIVLNFGAFILSIYTCIVSIVALRREKDQYYG